MNTPYALILTDSTHAPTVIGHYNSRQTFQVKIRINSTILTNIVNKL